MNNYIEKINIIGLFGKKNIEWTLGEVNILVGINGSGKTTILHILKNLWKQDFEKLSLFQEVDVKLNTGDEIIIKRQAELSDDLRKFLEAYLVEHNGIAQIENKNTANYQFDSEEVTFFLNNLLNKKPETSTKKDFNDINIDLISTVNMNANSINEINRINGDKTTLLDMEIDFEVEKFFKSS